MKENRLLLAILFVEIEEKDIIQVNCFIKGTKSYNDLDHIRNSSCNRSCHLIKVWKIHFYSLKLFFHHQILDLNGNQRLIKPAYFIIEGGANISDYFIEMVLLLISFFCGGGKHCNFPLGLSNQKSPFMGYRASVRNLSLSEIIYSNHIYKNLRNKYGKDMSWIKVNFPLSS